MNHSFRSVPNSPTENHQFASSSAGSSARNFQHQTSADSDSRPRRQGSQGGLFFSIFFVQKLTLCLLIGFVGTSSGLFGGNSEPANKNTNPIYGQGSVLESITGSISESVHDILSSGSQLFSDQRRQLFSNSDSTPYSFVSNMVKVMNKQCSSCTNTFTLFLRKVSYISCLFFQKIMKLFVYRNDVIFVNFVIALVALSLVHRRECTDANGASCSLPSL